MIFSDYTLILGSKSPRRKLLLEGIGFKVEVRTKEVEENYPDALFPNQIPVYLAQQKAAAFSNTDLKNNEILITADTVVIINKQVLGKPKNESEAIQMLQILSGNIHNVITGVCIKSNQKQHSFCATTDVFFRNLTLEEIKYYVQQYKPFDKAGSYGIQEWIGYVGVEYIKGSYFNVMGLPTQKLYTELVQFLNS